MVHLENLKMKTMNETIKNNLEKMYHTYGDTFKNLSFSTEHNKSCVISEARAINGDQLKTNCCKKSSGIESVDAISFNKNKMKFIFIEFKIKQIKNLRERDKFESLIKDLNEKFAGSWNCFGHNIDKYHDCQKNKIEKIFVYKIKDKMRDSMIEFNPLKRELQKYNIAIISAKLFEEKVKNYEYRI